MNTQNENRLRDTESKLKAARQRHQESGSAHLRLNRREDLTTGRNSVGILRKCRFWGRGRGWGLRLPAFPMSSRVVLKPRVLGPTWPKGEPQGRGARAPARQAVHTLRGQPHPTLPRTPEGPASPRRSAVFLGCSQTSS